MRACSVYRLLSASFAISHEASHQREATRIDFGDFIAKICVDL